MKKIIALVMCFATMLWCISCAPAEETESPSPSPMASAALPSESIEPSSEAPAPTEPPLTQKGTSLTTGLATDKEYKPFCIMVENSLNARPQSGLQEADIIYEAMAEGGITRFICIFNDHYPVKVGPIRSTRLYYVNIQREWDAPLVHYGGPGSASRPSNVYGPNFDDIKLRLDGLKSADKYGKYFWRDSERKAPNNVYTDVTQLLNEYKYTPGGRARWNFDANIAYEGETVSRVGIPFLSKKPTHTSFQYDKKTDTWLRSVGGKAFDVRTVTKDEEGNEKTKVSQLSVKNLIIQYAHTYTFENDIKGRRNVDVVGKGKCEYFIGGKRVAGYWERESLSDYTKYYLEDGKTLVTLKPGNTWICMQPDSDTVTVE